MAEARYVASKLTGDNHGYEELAGYGHFVGPFQPLLDCVDFYCAHTGLDRAPPGAADGSEVGQSAGAEGGSGCELCDGEGWITDAELRIERRRVRKSKQKAVVVDATGQKTTVGGVKGAKKQSKMQTQFIVNHLPGSTRRKAEAKWQWHISKLERRKEDLVGRLAEICRLQQEQTGGGKEGGEDGGNVGFGGVGTSEGGLDMVGVGKKSRKAERRQKRLDVEEEAKGKSRSKANKGKGNERKMNGAGAQGHGLMKQKKKKKKKLKARGKEAPAAAALDWPTEDSESTTESVGGNGQGSEGWRGHLPRRN